MRASDWLPLPGQFAGSSPGGNAIVEGTRIGVHDVVGLIVNGSTVEDVVRSFPDLTRAQVYECLAYYKDHRAEIDSLVARQMSSELRGSSSTILDFAERGIYRAWIRTMNNASKGRCYIFVIAYQ
jgi:uncharacterized protein (DUF433 family)